MHSDAVNEDTVPATSGNGQQTARTRVYGRVYMYVYVCTCSMMWVHVPLCCILVYHVPCTGDTPNTHMYMYMYVHIGGGGGGSLGSPS